VTSHGGEWPPSRGQCSFRRTPGAGLSRDSRVADALHRRADRRYTRAL